MANPKTNAKYKKRIDEVAISLRRSLAILDVIARRGISDVEEASLWDAQFEVAKCQREVAALIRAKKHISLPR